MWLMSDSGLSAATAGKLPVGREGASRRRQRRPNMCRIMVSIQCSESWSVYSPMFRVMVSIQSYLHSHDQYTVLCSESWSIYSLIFTVMVSIPSYVHSHGQYTVLCSQSWSEYPPMFTVVYVVCYRELLGRTLQLLEEFDAATECLLTAVELESSSPIVAFPVIPRALV